MEITVKLIGPLIHKLGFSEKIINIKDNTTLKELVKELNVEDYKRKVILRNGKPIKNDDILKNGDRIVISHIYSGG